MIRTSFNRDWIVGPSSGFFNIAPDQQPKRITLPHDATIGLSREANARSGGKKGYFPDGTYEYVKKFFVPEEYRQKRMTFEFEGVYMNAMVYINGDFAGQHPYGYSNFYIKADRFLKYGEENDIKVVARSHDDSRWYTGTGIYRNTKQIIANLAHFKLDGIKITTSDHSNERATVNIATTVENEGINVQATRISTEIIDAEGNVVAGDTVPLTTFAGEQAIVRQRLIVKHPQLWSVETPYLYTCKSKLVDGEKVLDEETHTFGIRSLSLNAETGLTINGEMVKLRGACIHHDNGVIGSATIDRAEERRIEILKQAGFNAVRSSHQPVSKATLEACDRVGMLVVDESFDIWTNTKSDYDYALHFPTWWEKDLEAMVAKNFNHPSVILYSIGNEIKETGSAHGAAWGRKLAEKIRSMDPARYVMNSINGFVSVMDKLSQLMGQKQKGDVNTAMANAGDMIKHVQSLDFVKEATEESFAAVDVAGYNYAENLYVADCERFPNRIICGSETFPKDIADIWKLVKEKGQIIGDFTWTGWDYLGESGLGRVEYGEVSNGHGASGAFPWLTAYCGDIDITGHRRPASYYREIVFGLRKEPYIAVQRPMNYGEQPAMMPWSWSDSISSWSWRGFEEKPIKIEVYSDAEELELSLNGTVIGRKPVGEAYGFKAEFDAMYQHGELMAVAYTRGKEVGRTFLTSAGSGLHLQTELDRGQIRATDSDLAFVRIKLVDNKGVLNPLADRSVSVTVTGAGVLQGLGSADPKNAENYTSSTHSTYDGEILAVIRPEEAGSIDVVIEAEGCESCTIRIEAT